MAGFFIGLSRTLLVLTLIVTVLGLIGMGGVLALAHVGDAPLETVSGTLERYGIVGVTDEMRLSALWGHLAVPVYTCASIALLSLVSLFIIRKPKPTRHTPVEGPA